MLRIFLNSLLQILNDEDLAAEVKVQELKAGNHSCQRDLVEQPHEFRD